MFKYILTALVIMLFAVGYSYAGGNELAYFGVDELPTLTNTSVVSGDFTPVLDVSVGKVRKVSAGILATTATATELNTLDGITASTAELNIMDGVTATAGELNKIADDSARIVSVSGATALTCAANGTGVINYVSSSASNFTGTLDPATGSGCGFLFVWDNVPTASGDIIQVTGDDEFQGVVYTLSDDTDALKGWAAAAAGDNDQITYTSSTQMGATAGVTLLVTDVTTDVYAVEAVGSSTGTEVTPFATGQRP